MEQGKDFWTLLAPEALVQLRLDRYAFQSLVFHIDSRLNRLNVFEFC